MPEFEKESHSVCNNKECNKECRNHTRISLLESRVASLENGQAREELFRKTYYSDRDTATARNARLDEKINNMDEKLDSVKTWVDEQKSKHGNRWEIIVITVIELLIAASFGAICYNK